MDVAGGGIPPGSLHVGQGGSGSLHGCQEGSRLYCCVVYEGLVAWQMLAVLAETPIRGGGPVAWQMVAVLAGTPIRGGAVKKNCAAWGMNTCSTAASPLQHAAWWWQLFLGAGLPALLSKQDC